MCKSDPFPILDCTRGECVMCPYTLETDPTNTRGARCVVNCMGYTMGC